MCNGVAPPVLISFTKSGNLSSKGLMALGPRRSALLIGVYPPPAYTGPGFELCPYKRFESFKRSQVYCSTLRSQIEGYTRLLIFRK